MALALGGCGAVEAWRSMSGVAKNDPDPQTALFARNIAEGETAPYPNLASVPPPPSRASSTAERQKLTESLVADRAATAASGGASVTADAGAPIARRAAMPTKPAQGAPAAAELPLAEATPTSPSAAAAVPPLASASVPGRLATTSPQSARRRAGEPPEPAPRESSLQMPEVRSLPEPEAVRPALPQPALTAAAPSRVSAAPPPPPIAAAGPAPAPPVPVLAPVPPPPAITTGAPKRPPAATTVATLDVRGPFGTPDRAQIERVAALYKENPGTVRVVGYAPPPSGSDPLANYHAALDRAQAVARALTAAGIPTGKIQTEAAPASGAIGPGGTGRIDIQFSP